MDSQSVDNMSPRVALSLGYLGNTPAWTSIADTRMCYFLYVPQNYHALKRLQLIVLIHSSYRTASELRTHFAEFAEKYSCLVLAPLFPVRPDDPKDCRGYKKLKDGDIRYDKIVLSMAEEVQARYKKVDIDRFLMFGFSGGGQFVHRFAYLHPQRLRAIACCAPGSQTLPDETRSFPEGVKDLQEVFGISIQWEVLRRVPAMFIVGGDDTDTFYVTARGRTLDPEVQNGRVGATVRLEKYWREAGAQSHLLVVPGVSHQEDQLLGHVMLFFQRCLEDRHEDAELK
ncbi:uncharacterized protein N7482_006577 [Penicillium canariense]|uniref:Uncharacterized protein n=1 Tax=Penicillium canariense TaxID=189055 RepID=A0A9W9LJI1_9EURO|nr:uncharacterized protein N7482_006577 [Penicillium canariense]KAJ5159573.1 hypothetical protein N7482_006577 [Penicillium canariense]